MVRSGQSVAKSETSGTETYPSGSVAPVGSLVTMGLRSVPFRLFFPPFAFAFTFALLAAEAATLAICFPLLKTALVISTPSIMGRW